jgi:pentatricopeptide repeat protein
MKKNKSKQTSLLTKYSLLYEKNPKSRVFAPLAESYRKLGMLDDAFKILRKGIKNHPTYTLGYIVLAHCYYDKEQYEIAYNTLRPFVANNVENISLQKLFAETCVKLGYLEEALNSYKGLLLINPKDIYVAEQVKLLEDDLLLRGEEEPDIVPQRRLEDSAFNDEDDWVQVDFNKETPARRSTDYEQWTVEKSSQDSPLDKFKSEVKESKLDIQEHRLDDNFFLEEYDNQSEETIDAVEDELTEEYTNKPIITHTLVDLYCKQGHYEKALEILESILELHPEDSVSRRRLDEVKRLMHGVAIEPLDGPVQLVTENVTEVVESQEQAELPISEAPIEAKSENKPQKEPEKTESDGHNELLSLIEEKKKKDKLLLEEVKSKLLDFLAEIKETAKLKNVQLHKNSDY